MLSKIITYAGLFATVFTQDTTIDDGYNQHLSSTHVGFEITWGKNFENPDHGKGIQNFMNDWFDFYDQYPQAIDNTLSMYFIETVDLVEARFVCQDK